MTDPGAPTPLPPNPDSTQARRDALRELIPEAFVDGVLDVDALARAVGEERPERGGYGLVWPGKSEAQRAAGEAPSAALVPDPDSSVGAAPRHAVVEGDNLPVLQLLQTAYGGAFKLIYIDPPYNTGREFIYPDNFRDPIATYLERAGSVEGWTGGNADGRYHRRWLDLMLPRLTLARRLLRPDGLIAVSIDDHEVHNLRLLLDEVFGPQNFVAQLIWKKKSGGGGDVDLIVTDHEYILVYARGPGATVFGDRGATVSTSYPHTDPDTGRRFSLERLDKASLGYAESLDFPIEGPDGAPYVIQHRDPAHKVRRWRWSRESVATRYDELVFRDGHVYTRNWQKESARPRSLLVDERFGRTRTGKADLKALFGADVHDFPKPVRLLAWLVSITTQGDDRILDFFAGSGALGEAVLQANHDDGGRRRFVLVQLPHPTKAGSHAHTQGLSTLAATCRARVARALEARGCEDGFSAWRLDRAADDRAEASPAEHAAELLLRAGVPLDSPVDPLPDLGAHTWTSGGVLVCLEPSLDAEGVEQLLTHAPGTLIVADAAFTGRDALLHELWLRREDAGIDALFTVG